MCDSMAAGSPGFTRSWLKAQVSREYLTMSQSSSYQEWFLERKHLFEQPLTLAEYIKLSAVSFVVCIHAIEGSVLTQDQIASLVDHLLGPATPCANARLWAMFLKGQYLAYELDVENALR